jgi:hypothetical protein
MTATPKDIKGNIGTLRYTEAGNDAGAPTKGQIDANKAALKDTNTGLLDVSTKTRTYTTKPAQSIAVSLDGSITCFLNNEATLYTVHTQTGEQAADKLENAFPFVSMSLNTDGTLLVGGYPTLTDAQTEHENTGTVAVYYRTSPLDSKWKSAGLIRVTPRNYANVIGDGSTTENTDKKNINPAGAYFGSSVKLGVYRSGQPITMQVPAFDLSEFRTATVGDGGDGSALKNKSPDTPNEDAETKPTAEAIASAKKKRDDFKQQLDTLHEQTTTGPLPEGMSSEQAQAKYDQINKKYHESSLGYETLVRASANGTSISNDGDTKFVATDMIAVSGVLIPSNSTSKPIASAAFVPRDNSLLSGHVFPPTFSLIGGIDALPIAPTTTTSNSADPKFDKIVHTTISADGTRCVIAYGKSAWIFPSGLIKTQSVLDLPRYEPSGTTMFFGEPAISHDGYTIAIPYLTSGSQTSNGASEASNIKFFFRDQIKSLDPTVTNKPSWFPLLQIPLPSGTHSVTSTAMSPDGLRLAVFLPEFGQIIVYSIDPVKKVYGFLYYNGFGVPTKPFPFYPGSHRNSQVDLKFANNQQLVVACGGGIMTGVRLFGKPPVSISKAIESTETEFMEDTGTITTVLKPDAPAEANSVSQMAGSSNHPADPESDTHDPPVVQKKGLSLVVLIGIVATIVVILAIFGVAGGFLLHSRGKKN